MRRLRVPSSLLGGIALLSAAANAQVPDTTRLADSLRTSIEAATNAGDIGRINEAIVLADRALAAHPSSPILLHYKGYALYRAGSLAVGQKRGTDAKTYLDSARALFEVLVKGPTIPESHALLSAVYGLQIGVSRVQMIAGMKLGPRAKSAMDRAVAAAPKNPRVLLLEGINDFNTPSSFGGGLAKAEQHLKDALAQFAADHPPTPLPAWGQADVHLWLGQVYARQKKPDAARTEYEAALALQPQNSWIIGVLMPALAKIHPQVKRARDTVSGMTGIDDTGRTKRVAHAALYTAAWIPVALGFSIALGATGILSPRHAAVAGPLCTLPAALFGIPVLTLCRRLSYAQGRVAASLGAHVVASALFSALWAGSIATEIALSGTRLDVRGFVNEGLAWQLVMGVLTYAVVAGVASSRTALRRQQEQARAAERAETLRLRAELEALRARLDPHFLFNVLQTIGALVEHQPQDTHHALEYLASLLKRRLVTSGDADDDTSLAEELEDVREYCALERLRLGARLELVERIEPDTLALRLPRFTLQPLVENAIRHGIAPRTQPGRLTVQTMRSGDVWTLVVSDNGVGADQARVAAARGLGLSVVRERVALRRAGVTSFSVQTSPGDGFTVTVKLPATESEGADERSLAAFT